MWEAETGAGEGGLVREVPAGSGSEVPGTLEPARIREIRRSLKLTQAAFAERVGCSSPVTVCRWETGVSQPIQTFRERIMRMVENG